MKQFYFSLRTLVVVLFGLLSINQTVAYAQDSQKICFVDSTAGGTQDGLSWETAYMDLQSALNDSTCTEIHVAAGTYFPATDGNRSTSFLLRSGVTIIGGYTAGGGETPDITVNETVLSGDIGAPGEPTDNSYWVINGNGADATAILDGFTITSGYADSMPNSGAGIYISDGSPTLKNLAINNNHSTGNGGGIYLNNSSSELTNINISSNYAPVGGGLSITGSGSPDLSGVNFNNNSANNDGAGAAISGDATLTDVTFQANVAGKRGGGLFINNGGAVLSNVTFTGNESGTGSTPGYGGGMYILGGATPSLTSVTFSSNSATLVGPQGGKGGGMYISGSDPSFSDVTFENNTADIAGGGIFIDGGNANLENVTLSSNIAGPGLSGGSGGGVYIAGNASPGLTNLTFSDNQAVPQGSTGGKGGGLFIDGGSAILDTVIFNHNLAGISSGTGGGGMYVNGGTPSLAGVTFQLNQGYDGGGLWSQTNISISNSTFDQNIANHFGGGMYINSGSPTLSNITFQLNEAYDGAGLWSQSDFTQTNSVFDQNRASNNGGGMYGSQNPSISDSQFNSNQAGQSGGGLYLLNSNASLSNTTFSANTALIGGGANLEGGNATFTDTTFSDNLSTGPGAGMYLHSGSSSLSHVQFDGNMATSGPGTQQGGGLHIYAASPNLSDVTFTDNAAKSEGGGIFNNGGSPTLHGVTFERNQGSFGGGMYSVDGSSTLSDVTFSDNIAEFGGGYASFDSPTEIFGCEVTGNQATRDNNLSEGGGLWVMAPLTLTNCRLDGNTAGIYGGGLYLNNSGPNNITNLTVTNNSLTEPDGVGGGIFCGHNGTFTNLLLAGNAAYQGGGFANYDRTVEIINATIYGNSASGSGSAIYSLGGERTISNTIVWGNSGEDILDDSVSISNVISSLLENGCPAGTTCTGLVSDDPLFVDASNGNFHIQNSSPAVDAGLVSALPEDVHDLDGDNNITEPLSRDLDNHPRIVISRVDIGALEAQIWNTNWTEALFLNLNESQPDVYRQSVNGYLDKQGQSRWYKFTIQPDSKVLVTLTGLPANYDLTLYKDISQAFTSLNSSQDLLLLSAEFAPDTFSPDTFSPDTFSPDTFSPDTFSPDTFSPDTFSPDTFSPDTFSPDTFSPDTFSPDTFSPDTFSPDTFSPDTFSPDTFSPDTFYPDTCSQDTFSPDTFSSSQTRSLIALSAHEGTQGEGIAINTWTKSGEFYVRVRGRNGTYNADSPFNLQVTMLSGSCGSVSPVLPASNTLLTAAGFRTLILSDLSVTEGTSEEIAQLQTKLSSLAARTYGMVVDIGNDAQVSAAFAQAQSNPACVNAVNIQAGAIKNIIDSFWQLNPQLEYIVLAGNDHAIPFFRYPDNALLASEIEFSPPVLDNSTSQASLKSGYILSQDAYGAAIDISYKAGTLPVPQLAVGRLVETASDINHLLDAYLGTADGIVSPASAMVTGYDFLTDSATAVRNELQTSLGDAAVDSLIMDSSLSPQDPSAWTADDLRSKLFSNRHDMVFLAGHFSANSALAADYKTHLNASEVLESSTDFTNSLIYSAGCHSGYNIVNADDVPNVTREPDWAQVFAAKGATFIGGTGYQYGDTEFIEYSERLYLEFTRQLRYGSLPVPVGKALVQAKQYYLTNTPLMRGIHEKSVLEATLFGLPMLQFNLPGRIAPPENGAVVSGTTPFTENPGQSLGLEYADLHITPATTFHTVALNLISGNGENSFVDATYLEGPDNVVVNAGEPILPLDNLNVKSPKDGFVLRNVGWRGGEYSDYADQLPLTGAATEDLRAPHTAFFSDVFYPVRPWNLNYFDALSNYGGATILALMPAQYRSSYPGSLTGTTRQFNTMDLRLYYSGNFNTYENTDESWTNTPALAAPPDISLISSHFNEDGTVSFEITVTGDPAAGIQEVWVVYTFENSGTSGTWLPLDLVQDIEDTRLWKGSIDTSGASIEDLRFVVQAVNGVGLGTMMTNAGDFYRAGVDPGALASGTLPVVLTLEMGAGSGEYGSQQSFSVIAAQDNTPVADLPIMITLGGQSKKVVTSGEGTASANFFLGSQPGEYTVTAAFAGNDTYTPAEIQDTLIIGRGTSIVALEPVDQTIQAKISPQFVATVIGNGLPLSGKPVALTLESGGVIQYSSIVVTDYAGQAYWELPPQPAGSYSVKAWYGLKVTEELDLTNPLYTGSSASATLNVYQFSFTNFSPPLLSPPKVNKVNSGSSVPVKFGLGGDFGLNIFATNSPLIKKMDCKTNIINPLGDPISTSASGLTYDPFKGLYSFIWKTDKKWTGTCGALVLKFVDGTEEIALFQFIR